MLPWMLRSRRPHSVLSTGTARLFLKPIWQAIPHALADCLSPYHLKLARLGLEAGPLSEWLVRGLGRHGFRALLMETRHVRAAARIAEGSAGRFEREHSDQKRRVPDGS